MSRGSFIQPISRAALALLTVLVSLLSTDVALAAVALADSAEFSMSAFDGSPRENSDNAVSLRATAASEMAQPSRTTRRVRGGMCSSDAQSVDAPPNVYGGTLAVAFGCSTELVQFKQHEGNLPSEQVSSSFTAGKVIAVVESGAWLPSRIATTSAPTGREVLLAEEHRNRPERPPRL